MNRQQEGPLGRRLADGLGGDIMELSTVLGDGHLSSTSMKFQQHPRNLGGPLATDPIDCSRSLRSTTLAIGNELRLQQIVRQRSEELRLSSKWNHSTGSGSNVTNVVGSQIVVSTNGEHIQMGDIQNNTDLSEEHLEEYIKALREERQLRASPTKTISHTVGILSISQQRQMTEAGPKTEMEEFERDQLLPTDRCNQPHSDILETGKRPPDQTPLAVDGMTRYKKFGKCGVNKCDSESKHNTEHPPHQYNLGAGRSIPPHAAVPVSLPSDRTILSDYQFRIRAALEFFQATREDCVIGFPGRTKPVVVGQVGIRCRYCAHLLPHHRQRGSAYFPGKLTRVYQSAQNMASNHLLSACRDVPDDVRDKLTAARERQDKECRRAGGMSYWMETCRFRGLEERQDLPGVWFQAESK